jgi:hypothetical protein
MTQSSLAVTEVPRFQFGLAARLAVIAIVFVAEKTLLNTLIDFHRPLAMLGLDGFAQMVHYQGMPFVVVLAAAAALFAYLRGPERVCSPGPVSKRCSKCVAAFAALGGALRRSCTIG